MRSEPGKARRNAGGDRRKRGRPRPAPEQAGKVLARNTNPTAAIVAGSRSIQMLTPKTCVAAAISGTSGG